MHQSANVTPVFNVQDYLERIGFVHREGEVESESLRRLHRCHVSSVPFEAIDIFCGLPISLSVDDLYKKVVINRRGGYCFELNHLFYALLERMGFKVSRLLCRTCPEGSSPSRLSHRQTAVTIGDDIWLADVGYGGNGWSEPLLLQHWVEQHQYGRTYRIIPHETAGNIVQIKRDDAFINVVAFDFRHTEEVDFMLSSYYTSTHPDSSFIQHLMCAMYTEDGRNTLRDRVLKLDRHGEVTERELRPEEICDVLHEYFNLKLPSDMCATVQNRLQSL